MLPGGKWLKRSMESTFDAKHQIAMPRQTDRHTDAMVGPNSDRPVSCADLCFATGLMASHPKWLESPMEQQVLTGARRTSEAHDHTSHTIASARRTEYGRHVAGRDSRTD